jgi:hypothetical protein
MDNEARLAAMRWAARARLELNKGTALDRRRDQILIDIINSELAQGFLAQKAESIILDCDMQLAFEKLGWLTPKEREG